MKSPRNLSAAFRTGEFDPLGYEILQEKAATLARLGGRLEKALADLTAFDAAHPEPLVPGGEDALQRQRLVATAGEVLWYYVVQREVCGLRDTDTLLRHLGVPREVRLRMGFFPAGSER